MHGPRRQAGMTFLGWLVILVMVGFYVFLGLKIGPIYLDHYKVKSLVAKIKNENPHGQQAHEEIKQRLLKEFYINEIRTLDAKHITIKQIPGGTLVSVDYEVEQPIVGNLLAVVRFNEQQEIKNR